MLTNIKRLHRYLVLRKTWEDFSFTLVPEDHLIALFSTVCLISSIGLFIVVMITYGAFGQCSVLPQILLAICICGLLIRYPWEFFKKFRSLLTEKKRASLLVPEYLRKHIDEIEDKTIGRKSRFGRILEKVRNIRLRVEGNLGEITMRLRDRPEAVYLKELRPSNEKVLERAQRVENELVDIQEKIENHFLEHRKAVGQTADLLRRIEALEADLELAKDTISLGREIDEAEREALIAVDEAINQINGLTDLLRREVTQVFEKSLIGLTTDLPIDDPHCYLATVEQTVKELGMIELKSRLPTVF